MVGVHSKFGGFAIASGVTGAAMALLGALALGEISTVTDPGSDQQPGPNPAAPPHWADPGATAAAYTLRSDMYPVSFYVPGRSAAGNFAPSQDDTDLSASSSVGNGIRDNLFIGLQASDRRGSFPSAGTSGGESTNGSGSDGGSSAGLPGAGGFSGDPNYAAGSNLDGQGSSFGFSGFGGGGGGFFGSGFGGGGFDVTGNPGEGGGSGGADGGSFDVTSANGDDGYGGGFLVTIGSGVFDPDQGDNPGGFDITLTDAAPEPSSCILGLLAAGLMAALLRFRMQLAIKLAVVRS